MRPRSVSMMMSAVFAASSPVLGVTPQVSVSHGIDFVTIGDPGNKGFDGNAIFQPLDSAGSVPYEYRLSRTEITSGQFLEFINAVSGTGPEWARFGRTVTFPMGLWDWLPNGGYRYHLRPGTENVPVQSMSFIHAAMYANWLHNDKAPGLDAIKMGAYDLRDVGIDDVALIGPEFTYERMQPLPGARFWVPSIGEWMKGGFYDPDKNGQGPGWWNYANVKDRLPVYGPPDQGGESNAGVMNNLDPYYPPDTYYDAFSVGEYPEQQSPWGLLDVSGGVSELTSGFDPETFNIRAGAALFGTSIWADLRYASESENPTVGRDGGISVYSGSHASGLRLAATVPEPSVLLPLCYIGCSRIRRRE